MPDRFEASASTLGYLYQIRLALLLALRRGKLNIGGAVVVEGLDDIEFLDDEGPQELIQAKHRVTRRADLSNASTDLWKSLRIWIERCHSGTVDSGSTRLFLVTTSEVSAGSAAAHLREMNRDVAEAERLLTQAARDSENRQNARAYALFLALAEADRIALLDAVWVLDGHPDVLGVRADLETELHYSVRPTSLSKLVDRLEGWWIRVVTVSLTQDPSEPIPLLNVAQQVHDLSEQFRAENLPIDFADLTLDGLGDADDQRPLVEQLRLIKLGSNQILRALLDYYKAFHQRSRWMKDGLLVPGELARYERRLIDEWQRHFDRLADELPPEAAEDEKQRIGRGVYRWAEDVNHLIRKECTEPYVCRGSYQILSDRGEVGWHPEFADRLATILAEAS